MSWKQTEPMHQRHLFIADYASDLYSITELAVRYGISRKTAYKWIDRFEADGSPGLADRSRAPLSCPHRTDPQVEAVVIALRQSHPSWGARTLRAIIARRHPQLLLPAASTITALLQRHGLIDKRPPRRRAQPGVYSQHVVAEAANDLWCIDFKGEFRLGNGRYCYPLTITDAYSRVVLECYGLPSTAHAATQRRLELLFREYGLPTAIRSDNGVPFVSPAPLGLSRLSIWWMKLGIVHQRIMPAHPEQNGRHERMHRTLKAETTRPPAGTFAAQQACFDRWRVEYNSERPHQGIGQAVPIELYTSSPRPFPKRLPQPAYAGHCEVRRVANNGMIRFHSRRIFLSAVLAQEDVALEEIDDGIWNILLYDRLLGRLDQRDYQLH
jgi:putative transposase